MNFEASSGPAWRSWFDLSLAGGSSPRVSHRVAAFADPLDEHGASSWSPVFGEQGLLLPAANDCRNAFGQDRRSEALQSTDSMLRDGGRGRCTAARQPSTRFSASFGSVSTR